MSELLPPLLGEPLSVELANTLFALRREPQDGLVDAAGYDRWLTAIGDRLLVDPHPSLAAATHEAVRLLRDAVRVLFTARDGEAAPDAAAVAVVNDAAALAPSWLALTEGAPSDRCMRTAAGPEHRLLSAFATDAVEVMSSPVPVAKCPAEGCLLFFVKNHPRRSCCSTRCANRIRAARHYARKSSPGNTSSPGAAASN